MRDLQAVGLGDAQAAAVEDLEDGAVAKAGPAGVGVDGVEDAFDFFDGEDFGEVAAELGGVDAVAGVVLPLAFEDEPVEEGAQRAEQPRLASLAQRFSHSRPLFCHSRPRPGISSRAGRQVFFDVLRPYYAGRQVQRRQQLRDVAPVGRHRVRRQPALHPQVVAVVLQDPAVRRHLIDLQRVAACSSPALRARARR